MIRIGRFVYRVLEPGEIYPFDSISTLIVQPDHISLIDTGTGLPGVYELIMQRIISLGLGNKKILRVYNTHCHVNNAGGDYWFWKRNGSTIAVHILDSKALRSADPYRTDSSFSGIKMEPVGVGYELRKDEDIVEEGNIELHYIHTPGHTPGSTTYLIIDPIRKIVVLGDALGSLREEWGSNESQWFETLEKIKSLEADLYCNSIKCYTKQEFTKFLDVIEKEGPIWLK